MPRNCYLRILPKLFGHIVKHPVAASILVLTLAASCDVEPETSAIPQSTKKQPFIPPTTTTKTEPCQDNPLFTIRDITRILPYVDDHTLVVFDIDQTLIMDPKHAGNVNYAIPNLEFVEPTTKAVLEEVIAKGAKVIGLTARGYFDANNDDAHMRLRELGFDLTCPWLDKTRYKSLNVNVTNFVKGFKNCIFYANYASKAATLLEFLTEIETHAIPVQRVIFVDDSKKHCKDISSSLQKRNVNSCVFHYTKAFDQ